MKLYSEMLQAAQKGLTVQIITLIKAPHELAEKIGEQILLYPDGDVKGCIIDSKLTGNIQDYLATKGANPILRFCLPEFNGLEFFCDTLLQIQRAVVLGGGHISQPLVEFLARVGYEVTVVDDRPDFANQARFPDARQVLCCSFVNAFSQFAMTRNTAVVIVTRGHQHDLECLRQVIAGDAFYIGMIGSKYKVATVIEALLRQGVDQDLLRRVHAPIGLDIHAQSPAEIALSIAAEIVSAAKGGSCLPLFSLRGGVAGD